MKKLLLASAAAAALVAGSAAAENDFTGFNFGLQGGLTHNKFEYKTTPKFKESKTGASLGAFAGYGYQFDNAMYLGAELEGNFFTGTASKSGIKTKAKNDLGANLRAGYVFDNNILAYVLAGVNTTDVEAKFNNVKKSKRLNGFKVGAGAEMKFADNYFARAQYDYKMTAKKAIVKGLPKTELDQHNVRLGLGMII